METWPCCNSFTGHQITTNVCTCHDSTTVVPCTKFCSDHCIGIEVRVKRNLHRIWIAMEEPLVMRVPGLWWGDYTRQIGVMLGVVRDFLMLTLEVLWSKHKNAVVINVFAPLGTNTYVNGKLRIRYISDLHLKGWDNRKKRSISKK